MAAFLLMHSMTYASRSDAENAFYDVKDSVYGVIDLLLDDCEVAFWTEKRLLQTQVESLLLSCPDSYSFDIPPVPGYFTSVEKEKIVFQVKYHQGGLDATWIQCNDRAQAEREVRACRRAGHNGVGIVSAKVLGV